MESRKLIAIATAAADATAATGDTRHTVALASSYAEALDNNSTAISQSQASAAAATNSTATAIAQSPAMAQNSSTANSAASAQATASQNAAAVAIINSTAQATAALLRVNCHGVAADNFTVKHCPPSNGAAANGIAAKDTAQTTTSNGAAAAAAAALSYADVAQSEGQIKLTADATAQGNTSVSWGDATACTSSPTKATSVQVLSCARILEYYTMHACGQA